MVMLDWWRSFLDSRRRQPAQESGFFGIRGLAETDAQFYPGRLSCLLLKEEGISGKMLLSCLLAARGRPAYLLCCGARAKFGLLSLFRSPELAFLEILETTGKFKTPASERQTAAFLRDVGRTRLPAGAAFFVFGAEELFCLAEQEVLARQLACWNAFAAVRRTTVVLCFREYLDPQSCGLKSCQASAVRLAEIDSDLGNYGCMRFLRWGRASGKVVQLAAMEGMPPLAAVGAAVSMAEQRVLGAAGQTPVFYCRADIPFNKGIPGHWLAVDESRDLLPESESCPVATLVLAFAEGGRFRELCELIYRLRLSRPRSTRIVVLETGAKLRHHQEMILLHVGVDTVIYREIPPSRAMQLIDDQAGLLYSRKMADSLEAALRAGEADPVFGYLPVSAFGAAVQGMLERTSPLHIGHCLVKLPLLSRASAIDALKSCCHGRDGNLITADKGALYVFLFACREADVDTGLASLWGEATEQLFESRIVCPDRISIASMLASLLESAAAGEVPDYSFVEMAAATCLPEQKARTALLCDRQSAEVIPIFSSARLRESVQHRSVRPVTLPLKGARHGQAS